MEEEKNENEERTHTRTHECRCMEQEQVFFLFSLSFTRRRSLLSSVAEEGLRDSFDILARESVCGRIKGANLEGGLSTIVLPLASCVILCRNNKKNDEEKNRDHKKKNAHTHMHMHPSVLSHGIISFTFPLFPSFHPPPIPLSPLTQTQTPDTKACASSSPTRPSACAHIFFIHSIVHALCCISPSSCICFDNPITPPTPYLSPPIKNT